MKKSDLLFEEEEEEVCCPVDVPLHTGKQCEYCGTIHSDSSEVRCPNCGAPLIKKVYYSLN